MIVSLSVLVAALTVALAVLASRLRQWQTAARRADSRLTEVNARVAQASAAGRAAFASVATEAPTHAAGAEPRSETTTPRPTRRARRAPALPDRP